MNGAECWKERSREELKDLTLDSKRAGIDLYLSILFWFIALYCA